MIEVEKGVPLPKVRQGIKRYPFDKMQGGDSFAFNLDELNGVRSQASRKSKPGRRFVVSAKDLRCWCIVEKQQEGELTDGA